MGTAYLPSGCHLVIRLAVTIPASALLWSLGDFTCEQNLSTPYSWKIRKTSIFLEIKPKELKNDNLTDFGT